MRKPNNVSTFDDEIAPPGQLTKKKSFMDSLHLIGAIARKDSFIDPNPGVRKKSLTQFSISDWDDLLCPN